MKATIELDLQPFRTPNFVIAKMNENHTVPLSQLDPITLDKMCRQFRDEVFRKAGKQQPPEAGLATGD